MHQTKMDELDIDGNRADYPPPRAVSGHAPVPQTNTAPSVLGAGDAILHWLYTNPVIELFEGPIRPNPDNVDYQLARAIPGMSPARERLEARGPLTDTSLPMGRYGNLYAHSSSPNIDFSIFAFVPLLIRRALCCRLHSAGGRARFRLTVCGSMRVWLGGEMVASFSPWSYNFEESKEIELELPAGSVDLTVELEDLHERNTVNYFAVTWLSGTEVACSVPAADPERVEDAMRVIDGLDFDRVLFEGGPLSLRLDHTPHFDLQLDVVSLGQMPRNHCYELLDIPEFTLDLKAGADAVTFPHIETLPTGSTAVSVCARINDLLIPKRLGTTILTRGADLNGADISARKAEVLELSKDDTGADVSVAMVHLSHGICTDLTRSIVEKAIRQIERRHDCSDFAYLPALRIWRDYRAAMPAELREKLRQALMGYRFWMSEPGNDSMWFWSENHILCFHIAQFVAGHFFEDQIFANSGRLGRDLQAEAQDRLNRWFDSIERFGLCEWNSAAYYPIDMLALFSLHDLSPDQALKGRAAGLLDRIFVMTGLHTIGGVPTGSQGRSYEKDLLSGPANELSVAAAIAFGGTYYPGMGRAAFSFCLSDYEPPAAAARFAKPAKGELIEAQYHQGYRQHGKLTLWKSDYAQMSTVSDHQTGVRGAQEHVIDVRLAGNPMARLWINHPGDRKPWSERRPSRLAGNLWLPRVAQDGNTTLMIYDLPDDISYIPHTHLFAIAEAFDELRVVPGGLLLRSGGACARVWCSAPLLSEERGVFRGNIFRAETRRVAWAVQLDAVETDAEVDCLAGDMAKTPLHFDAEALTLDFRDYRLNYTSPHLLKGGLEVVHDFSSQIPQVSVNGECFVPWTELA
ncbi:MAG: hypothetical protein ACOH2N_07335 [Devosia sp.]